jgi:phospholipid transport system substrate-binding protein
LDWRVVRGDDAMAIVDILVEGISMAVTQRSDFASVIQSRGGKVAGLLQALRDKAGSGEQSVAQ